jgi:hypothetical protein
LIFSLFSDLSKFQLHENLHELTGIKDLHLKIKAKFSI